MSATAFGSRTARAATPDRVRRSARTTTTSSARFSGCRRRIDRYWPKTESLIEAALARAAPSGSVDQVEDGSDDRLTGLFVLPNRFGDQEGHDLAAAFL